MIRTLTIAALLMLAVACGSDAVPTATSVPPKSAPFVPPPTPTGIADVSAGAAELLGLERLREFPEELKSGSPPLDREEAAEIARVFLSDTRTVGSDSMVDYCSDGTGLTILLGELPDFEGESFHWEVQPNPAARWNKPRVVISYDNPNIAAMLLSGLGLAEISWVLDEDGINEEDPGEAFDNPTCGQ